MTKKIIITGAAGLVGQNVVPMLVKEGYHVVAIDRNPNLALLQRLNPSVKCIKADVSQHGPWEDECKGADIMAQLHAQIASRMRESFVQSNIEGVKNVLALCKKHKIKNLIHISSSVVISVAKDEYTRTKRIGEQLVRKSRIPHTILRPPIMYGLFDSKHLGWITRFMEKMPIVPVPGSGNYIRQPLYVKDLCRVIVALTKRKPKNETWNIIGYERITYINLLRMIAQARGWWRLFMPIPLPIFALLLRIYGWITGKPMFTPEQMKALVAGDLFPVEPWDKEFGVAYTPFDQGIRETWHSPESKYAKHMISPH